MRTIKYFAMVALAVCFAACGSKKGSDEETIVVKPAETTVSGDMEGCFTVVDKEYKATGDWGSGIITVEIERTDQDLPFELGDRELCSFSTSSFAANVQVGFGIEFLDADGNVLDKVSANGSGLSGSYDSDEAVPLVKLKPGKKGTIRFSVPDDATEAVSFRISSAYQENDASEDTAYESSDESNEDMLSDDESSDDEEVSSESGSTDWDALLDSYDSYVTKYIAFAKKAAKGDATALAEYSSLLKEAQEYSEKMSNAQGEMSASQWARYIKITSKMTKAASENK